MKKSILAAQLIFWSSASLALEPANIELGYFDIIPTATLNASNNDNIFRSAVNRVDSNVIIVSPNVLAAIESNTKRYTFQAGLEDGTYSNSPADDYTDWQIGVGAEIELNSRNELNLAASQSSSREERGTGFSETGDLPEEPLQFDTREYEIGYTFGSTGSRGRIGLDLRHADVEYDTGTLDEITTDQFVTNRKTYGLNTSFTLNMTPGRNLLFQYRYLKVDYPLDTLESLGSQDSDEHYGYLGVGWDTGSPISGNLLVGYGTKKYASDLRDDEDILSWDAGLLWDVYDYMNFTLSANRNFTEANATGNSITTTRFMAGWNHDWNQRISSTLTMDHAKDKFGGIDREDKINTASFDMIYEFRRWLDFSLGVRKEDRDSDEAFFNYSQRVISIGIAASL